MDLWILCEAAGFGVVRRISVNCASVLCAVVAGLGTGFYAGGFLAPGAAQNLGNVQQLKVPDAEFSVASDQPERSSTEKEPDSSESKEQEAYPGIGLRELLNMPEGKERYKALGAFLPFAKVDDLRLILKTWTSDGKRVSNYEGDMIFLCWADLEGAGALEWAKGGRWAGRAGWALTYLDPQAGIAAAERGDFPMQWLYHALAETDPRLGIEVLERNPDDREQVWRIAGRLAPTEIDKALEITDSSYRSNLPWDLWAADDPELTFDALGKMSPNGQKEVLGMTMRGLLAKDSNLAQSMVKELPPGILKERAALAVVEHLGERDPAAAERWIESVDMPVFKERALRALAARTVGLEPDRALELLRRCHFEEGNIDIRSVTTSGSSTMSEDRGGIVRTARVLAESRPVETAALFMNLPENSQSSAAQGLFGTIGSWAARDMEAASGWLASQPESVHRPAAVDALVRSILNSENADFDAALAWVRSSEGYLSVTEDLFVSIHRNDAGKALRELEDLGLSESRRREILRRMRSEEQ